ncbi:MAG: methionyl-tRNA formyltransferase [Chitinophagaceae bacterium]|nr:methionyl-tRNA formyltransferase [Chitinophagaceae bacterium]
MRIIFLGTPDFAVASLKALVEHGFNVVAVVTAPDRPAGRGMKLQSSAVKKYSDSQGLPLLQPEKLKAPEFLEALRSFQADLQVVVAFRMLPEVVWNMPPLGTINVHASLLPDYRGAAPINWAIINREKYSGVTTFKLKQAIDTGNILLQKKVLIEEEETAGTLHDKLMAEGAKLLIQTLKELSAGTLKEIEQDATLDSKHAPKLFTETCQIHWDKTAQDVIAHIRGLSPYPGAFTRLNGKLLKIYQGKVIMGNPDPKPGKLVSDGKTYLHICAADAWISVLELQIEGKVKMKVEDFLRGNKVTETVCE